MHLIKWITGHDSLCHNRCVYIIEVLPDTVIAWHMYHIADTTLDMCLVKDSVTYASWFHWKHYGWVQTNICFLYNQMTLHYIVSSLFSLLSLFLTAENPLRKEKMEELTQFYLIGSTKTWPSGNTQRSLQASTNSRLFHFLWTLCFTVDSAVIFSSKYSNMESREVHSYMNPFVSYLSVPFAVSV